MPKSLCQCVSLYTCAVIPSTLIMLHLLLNGFELLYDVVYRLAAVINGNFFQYGNLCRQPDNLPVSLLLCFIKFSVNHSLLLCSIASKAV